MAILIGSARIDERGKISGGRAGDQKQTSSANDTKGEVSIQKFYIHSKGWYIIRAVSAEHATLLAESMTRACNNRHIGYDQLQRLGIIVYGTKTDFDTECDCSSLVRQCIREATGKDPGNFNTATERDYILKMKWLFRDAGAYISQEKTPLYNGDILVTKTKGHTVIVVGGNQRTSEGGCYPRYDGSSSSIVVALTAVGERDISKAHRAKIAVANCIENYKFTAEQNLKMVQMLKDGVLKKA